MDIKIQSILQENFAYIIFSDKKKNAEVDFSRVSVKPFVSENEILYQFEYTVDKKVFHKNCKKDEFLEEITELITNCFNQCLIYGEKNDFHLTAFGKKIKVKTLPPTKKCVVTSHNKQKQYILQEGENIDFLIYLGVMTKDKKIVKSKYNKFRQINKYIELLTSSIQSFPHDKPIKVVDFGCGKAYLTFALYYYLVKILNRKVTITGLDLKEDVIDFCNKVAKDLQYNELSFQKGDIKDYNQTKDVDMVIMLHACDNATDEGIVQSIKFNAKIIIAVPCCQHEFFDQIKNDSVNPLLQYGILKERMSALVTDALRAQILKSIGYEVVMMEFIETEHTPKNIAIKAVKSGDFNKKEYDEYQKFKNTFNLTPYIEKRFIQENIFK